jgi:hypothetical protein
MNNADASDALRMERHKRRQYEETAKRRTLWPSMPVKPATGEPWRPVMTEQERKQHEQYVRENNLPF